MKKQAPVITVDGPSGSGKGVISHLLAKSLGWHLLDSGAIYRALAWIVQYTNTPMEEKKLLTLVSELTAKGPSRLQFIESPEGSLEILWKGYRITHNVRSEECGSLASQLAVYATVRQALLAYQRAFRQNPGLVADGRDMGSVVFPDALLKIFLEASLEERAKRRYLQLKAKEKHVSLESLLIALERRDCQDRQRDMAPLKVPLDGFIIDTTHLSIQEVLQRIQSKLNKVNKPYRDITF